jgi:hypothetical protein
MNQKALAKPFYFLVIFWLKPSSNLNLFFLQLKQEAIQKEFTLVPRDLKIL